MNKLFTEFENENALRTYPFASGCTVKDTEGVSIGTGILIDAALYPVNPAGDLYLSSIGVDGTVSISDARQVIMTAQAEPGASSLEFYDRSELRRHVGTLIASSAEALAVLTTVYEERRFKMDETRFASSCVFPVVNDGVLSLNIGETGVFDGDIAFANGDEETVRVATSPEGDKLRFDVIPQPHIMPLTSIQHIYCIVDGKTPFRIQKLSIAKYMQSDMFSLDASGDSSGQNLSNVVVVYLDNIDRQDICGDAHREDALVTRDTCGCESSSCTPDIYPQEDIPEIYQVEVVDIPNKADNAFYLAVPNMFGYDNPLSITMKDGAVIPIRDIEITDDPAADNLAKFNSATTSKGVVIQVPGLE